MLKQKRQLLAFGLAVCLLLTIAMPAQAQIIDFVDTFDTDIDYEALFDIAEKIIYAPEDENYSFIDSQGYAHDKVSLYYDLYQAFVLDPRLFIEVAAFREAAVQQGIIDMFVGQFSTDSSVDVVGAILSEVYYGYSSGLYFDFPSKSGREFLLALWAAVNAHKYARPQEYRDDYDTLFGEVFTKVDASYSQTLSWDLSVSLKEAPLQFIRELAIQSSEVQQLVYERVDYNDACGFVWSIQSQLEEIAAGQELNDTEADILEALQNILADAEPITKATGPDPEELELRNAMLSEPEPTEPVETTPPTTVPETTAPLATEPNGQTDEQPGNTWLVAVIAAVAAAAVGFFGGQLYGKKRK